MFLVATMLFRVVIAVCTLIRSAGHSFAAKAPQAPASGRLAAAIATNCAIFRLIRDGVERSSERTRSISKILPRRRGNHL